MSEGNEELYAREIIFNLILQKMNEVNNKTFVTGGNSGGISNSALLVTEIPINEKDNIINTYNAILKQFSEKGFDCSELNSAVGEYISNRKRPPIFMRRTSHYLTELYIKMTRSIIQAYQRQKKYLKRES